MLFLTPLTWCEYRQTTQEGTSYCDSFAGGMVEGMAFCERHHEEVSDSINKNEVMFVKVQDARIGSPRKHVLDGGEDPSVD